MDEPRCPVCSRAIDGARRAPPTEVAVPAPGAPRLCPGCGAPLDVPPTNTPPEVSPAPAPAPASAPAPAPAPPAPPLPQPHRPAPADHTCEPVIDPDDHTVPEREWDAAHPPPVPAPTSASRIEPGATLFGRYRIDAVLGQGGMGVVFKAYDAELRRDVALKTLLPDIATSANAIERFVREARAAARLRHPNIVQVHDVGSRDGLHYFTMDFIAGRNLEVARKDISPRRFLEILRDTARALHAAHEAGIVHRDVKPLNILLDRTDRPFVGDFGLAKEITKSEAEGLTNLGAIMGTYDYMSPEQANSELDHIGPRSDVWSLGVILYDHLAGSKPFACEGQFAKLVAIIDRDPEPPGRVAAREKPPRRVHRDLETICLGCLEKDPDRRYASAGELADDLERFLQGEVIHRTPASRAYRLQKWVLRNRAATAAIAAGVIVLGLIGWNTLGPAWIDVEGLPEDAHIHLDAADHGSQRTLLVWPARRVKVTASVPNKQDKEWEGQALAGKRVPARFGEFSSDSGLLSVKVSPQSAVLSISRDKEPVLKLVGPQEQHQLKVGTCVMTVEAPDYIAQTTGFTIQPGKATELTIRLEHDYGYLTASAATPGASLLVYPTTREEFEKAAQPGVAAPTAPAPALPRPTPQPRPAPTSSAPRPIRDSEIPRQEPLNKLALPLDRFKLDTGCYRLIYFKLNHMAREQFVRIDSCLVKGVPAADAETERKAKGIQVQRYQDSGWVARFGNGSATRFADLRSPPGWTTCGTALQPRERWSFSTGANLLGAPVLADLDGDGLPDIIAAANDGRLRAISARDHALLWEFAATGPLDASPALADLDGDGTPDCVVGSTDGGVYAVSGRTGRLLWSVSLEQGVGVTAALADLDGDGVPDVVVGAWDHQVHALSGRDGHTLWTFATGWNVNSSAACADLNGDGIPDVVVGSDDHNVYALSGRDGKELWRFATPKEVNTNPALADLDGDGTPDVLVGSRDGCLYAISGRTGSRLWVFQTGGILNGTPCLFDLDGDGTLDVVVTSADAGVYAVSGKTGRGLWRFTANSAIYGSHLMTDLDGDGKPEILVASDDGTLFAVSLSQGLLWSFRLDDTTKAAPVVGDLDGDGVPECVVTGNDGKIRVLAVKDVGPLRQIRTGAAWSPTPCVADIDGDGYPDLLGIVYDGQVWAYSGRDGTPLWVSALGADVKSAVALADVDRDGTPDVIAGATNGKLVALSGVDGRPLWTFATAGPITTTPAVADLNGDGIPDCVIGSGDKAVYAVSGKDGTKLWRLATGGPIEASATLGELDGDGIPDAVICSTDGIVYALSGKDARLLWQTSVGKAVRMPAVLADLNGDGVLDCAVVSEDGQVCTLSGRDGAVIWRNRAGEHQGGPVLTDLDRDGTPDCIVGLGGYGVYAFSGRDGRQLWHARLPMATGGAPPLADFDGDGIADCVVASVVPGANEARGEILVLSGRDGRPLWSGRCATVPTSSALLTDLDGSGKQAAIFPFQDSVIRAFVPAVAPAAGQPPRPSWVPGGPWDWLDMLRARRLAASGVWGAWEADCAQALAPAAAAPRPGGSAGPFDALAAHRERTAAATLNALLGRARLHLGRAGAALESLQAAAHDLPAAADVRFDLALALPGVAEGAEALAGAFLLDPEGTWQSLKRQDLWPADVAPALMAERLDACERLLADPAWAAKRPRPLAGLAGEGGGAGALTSADMQFARSAALLARGRAPEALPILDALVVADPIEPRRRAFRAIALEAAGRTAEAGREMLTAARLCGPVRDRAFVLAEAELDALRAKKK